jgi:hypothetical protein
MKGYKLVVTEQPPVPAGSVFCECKLIDSHGNELIYRGHMYFVCDADKIIIQYFSWLKGHTRALKKLGYRWKA